MKIAYAQMKMVAGHPDVNTKKILQLIDEARTAGADIVIFPELAVSGRMLGDVWWQQSFVRECVACGKEIIAASKKIVVIFGNVHISSEDMFNAIFVAKNGKLISEPLGKTFLIDDWDKYFSAPPDPPAIVNIKIGRKNYRVKFILGVDSPQVQSDFAIQFNTLPFQTIIEISHMKYIGMNCPMIRVDGVGIQNTGKTIYILDGKSTILNSYGEVVQFAEPFAECLNFIELGEIDQMPALELPKVEEVARIYQALHYGTKTFLEQIGMKKIVIGVSGGIDSAVAAALYTQVVGAENILLVNMPSVFNSATTKNLSEQLAKNLGCKYCVVPIQESVDWTVKQLESTPITYLGDGSTEQIKLSSFVRENIQARDRSARILATIAAAIGGVFTCNANKAETTVGYATLYGDAAGFLAALADLWKFQVYELAHYMNEKIYKREVIPQGIIDIVPSAELSTAQNVDEGKGDPLRYPYHDYLLRAFVEENVTPEEILRWYVSSEIEDNIGCEAGLVEKYFATPAEFIADLERWWKQFMGMGVAKRIQTPPILAVTYCPYGIRPESQNGYHFTQKYLELKNKLLAPKE